MAEVAQYPFSECDRYLANYLASRVQRTDFGVLPVSQHPKEQEQILRLMADAKHRHIPVMPGHYWPRPPFLSWDPDIHSYVPNHERIKASALQPRRVPVAAVKVQTH